MYRRGHDAVNTNSTRIEQVVTQFTPMLSFSFKRTARIHAFRLAGVKHSFLSAIARSALRERCARAFF